MNNTQLNEQTQSNHNLNTMNSSVKFTMTIRLFAIVSLFSLSTQAQKQKPLLTIAETPVFSKEFKRVYSKNLDLVKDASQKDVDEYLKLFINYKLKIKAALDAGLDKKQSYVDELATYRKQLASGYLTDTNVTEELVKEAYEHMQESVNASHILIQASASASPADTLAAYQKIRKARERIVNGEDFATVAKEYSGDPSVKQNNGDLGWFSAFRMVYPFEKAAYDTEVGEISEPFRTQFGYHILKVNERRNVSGEIIVAHIMLAANGASKEEEIKERIDAIYTQLEQGADFAKLAKQFSEDQYTSKDGGVLKKFSLGDLNAPEFEKAAFSLTEPNTYSKPVRSNYGWHIIKFVEKLPQATFEESKNSLEERIKKDSRSKLITDAFLDRLKTQYELTDNSNIAINALQQVIKSGDSIKPNLEVDTASSEELLKIKDSTYSVAAYMDFVKEVHLRKQVDDVEAFGRQTYSDFVAKKLLSYYETNLDQDNPDFAAVMTEYRDGLLLFDLMENKIWNAAKNDSVGLQKYFEANKENYKWPERYKLKRASTQNKETAEAIKDLWKSKKTIAETKEELKPEIAADAAFSEETIAQSDAVLPTEFTPVIDTVQAFEKDGAFDIIVLEEILPAGPKKLNETKGKVINDYQKDLEKKWLKELKEKYPVSVNKKILKKTKKELQS